MTVRLILILIFKLLPDNKDLFVSHVTWTVYESMLRILKHLKLNYHLNNLGKLIFYKRIKQSFIM